MPNPLNLLPNAVGQPGPQILFGQVAAPAPKSFTDPLRVVFPQWSPDYFQQFTDWPAPNGTTLPVVGTECVLGYDSTRTLWVIGWAGATSFTQTVGGVLSGSLPNPGLAPGAVTLGTMATGSKGLAAEAFSVYPNANLTLSTPAGTKLAFNTLDFDVSSRMDITSNVGRYTPQTAGYYFLSATAYVTTSISSTQTVQIGIYRNGTAAKWGQVLYGQNSVTVTAYLQANGMTDYFETWMTFSPASITILAGSANSYFCGNLIGRS